MGESLSTARTRRLDSHQPRSTSRQSLSDILAPIFDVPPFVAKVAAQIKRDYDKRMKSTPDPDPTPSEKMRAFKDGLRQVLTVSKSELAEREKQYQAERATKPKRGPKPRSSASGHASGNED